MPSIRHEMATRLVRLQPRSEMLSVEAVRLLMEDFARFLPMPEGVRTTAVKVGDLAAEWLVPTAGTSGTLLYLHGGGYCAGSIGSHRAFCARVALATRCEVLLLGYRLAPEHPFPAAIEDALAAYEWLVGDRGCDPEALLVGGDSAGGGLALALLLALKRTRLSLPAGAICLSPWVDLTMRDAATRESEVDDPMIRVEDAKWLAGLYSDGAELRDPLISPLYGDPSGLPPILVQIGTRELLLGDARRLASTASQVGVDVTLEEWPDLMHVWQIFAPLVPESVQAIESVGSWAAARLEQQLNGEDDDGS